MAGAVGSGIVNIPADVAAARDDFPTEALIEGAVLT